MSKRSRSRVATERLEGLFRVMTDELQSLSPVCPKVQHARDRFVQRMRKRARLKKAKLREETIDKFVRVNELVSQVKVSLDRDVESNARHFIAVMMERFTLTFSPEAVQTPLELSYLWDSWRFGPGTSNGVKGTHTVDKITQDMTCTARCEPFVRKLRSTNLYFQVQDGSKESRGVTVVKGSRLSTVPKNEDAMRTIAIEPSGNMCLQLAAGMYIEGALRRIGLDISTQEPKNKAKAQRGSTFNDLATIDLSSASDMISIDLVRALWPSDWFHLFMALRCDKMDLPDGRCVDLNMISTMGNGFTFPMMTMTILALIYGYRCTIGGPRLHIDWANTAVYGDDIIIPVSEYDGFVDVLQRAGLVVNTDKSYSDGPFRESCGGDYYQGYDVTPVYVQHLQTPQAIYVALNQVLGWCGEHRLYLPNTILYLLKQLDGRPYLIPEWHSPDEGLLTALGPKRYKYLSKRIHRVPLDEETPYKMMLAVGGYIDSSGPDSFYTPRSAMTKVRVREKRIPKGFASGWDPLTRSHLSSDFIAQFIAILL